MPKIVSKKKYDKVECLNPHTGARLNIDAEIYQLFFTAMKQTMKGGKAISWTDIVSGIKKYLKNKKIVFKKSVPWYTMTVKNDLEVNHLIETFIEKGKKLNRWKSKS